MKKSLLALTFVFSMNANAADPIGSITAIDNVLRATSLVDVVAKAISNGANANDVKIVPRLKVIADCGDCRLSNATKMLITSSYDDFAKNNDVTINQDEVTVFKVTSIFGRNSFLRGALGLLSGADIIKGNFEGDTQVISEYSVSHEMGIDEITQKLGESILKAQVIKNTLPYDVRNTASIN